MKATGIVRRIDDLGRIVIPKEIRKTLHIREADAMEIFTDREGQIILKKYSPIEEMSGFAQRLAESIAQVSGHMLLISDCDRFIAAAGGCREIVGKALSRQVEEKLFYRMVILAVKGDRSFIPVSTEETENFCQEIIVPVLSGGDLIGGVMMLENEPRRKLGEAEQKLALAAAAFLGRQME